MHQLHKLHRRLHPGVRAAVYVQTPSGHVWNKQCDRLQRGQEFAEGCLGHEVCHKVHIWGLHLGCWLKMMVAAPSLAVGDAWVGALKETKLA